MYPGLIYFIALHYKNFFLVSFLIFLMAKSKILLTIFPVTWPNIPPIGLGYLQAFLAQKDIDADIIDFNHIFYSISHEQLQKQWLMSCNTFLEENILSIIKENNFGEFQYAIEKMLNYDIIGLSCFKSNFETTLSVARLLKLKKDNLKIVLGGPEITRQFFKSKGIYPQKILQIADYLIAGEGELPLYNYLNGENTHGRVAQFNQMRDLSDLPFPRYTGVDLNLYPRKNTIPIQFSRGCIRRCNFCSERLLYNGFRTRDINSLIDEIKYHKTTNKIKYFVFYDSLINANLKKLELICDTIIERFGSINWEAQIAIRNDMDMKLFEKMKRSGCYSLFVGLESASDTTLKNMNKGFTVDDALNFFKRLQQAGLFFGVSIIVGYPGETESDFKNNLEFIIQHKDIIPQIAQINPFTYYDGTTADKDADYKTNPNALKKMEIFVSEIKKYGFMYTNAFIGNLMEK